MLPPETHLVVILPHPRGWRLAALIHFAINCHNPHNNNVPSASKRRLEGLILIQKTNVQSRQQRAKKDQKGGSIGIIVLVAVALVLTFFAFWTARPHRVASLPKNDTIVNVMVTQDVDGETTGYRANLADERRQYSVTRATYLQWRASKHHELNTDEALLTPSPRRISAYWVVTLLALLAAFCWAILLVTFWGEKLQSVQQIGLPVLAWSAGLVAIIWLIGLPAIRLIPNQTAGPKQSAVVEGKYAEDVGSGRYSYTDYYLLLTLPHKDGSALVQVDHGVYAGAPKHGQIAVRMPDRADQSVQMIAPRRTNWLLEAFGRWPSLLLIVVLGAGVWLGIRWWWHKRAVTQGGSSGESAAGVFELTFEQQRAQDQLTSRHFSSSFVGGITATLGLMVILFGGFGWYQWSAQQAERRIQAEVRVIRAPQLLSETKGRAVILKAAPHQPKVTQGAQGPLFQRIANNWAQLGVTLMTNADTASRATRDRERRAALVQGKALLAQVQNRESPEGTALYRYGQNAVETLTFLSHNKAADFTDYFTDYLLYMGAETLTLARQYYSSQVPPALIAFGKLYPNEWANANDAAAAFKENADRWAYAEQLKTRRQILAHPRPLFTLFHSEQVSQAEYDIAEVKLHGRTISAPGLTLTIGKAQRYGDLVYVPYTVQNQTMHVEEQLNLVNNFGIGFTTDSPSRGAKRVAQEYSAVKIHTLPPIVQARIAHNHDYLQPGQQYTAGMVFSLPKPDRFHYVVGGGKNRLLGSIPLLKGE
ncbi:hypothetical protein [Lacticaseibacillus hegangensis]|nr:hypothetical protein [Lacticaseibacillus hegangensis]